MGCLLDDLRAFGINADQWTTAVQDEGGWRKTAEQGTERFMAEWIDAESQGWTTACSSMPERDGKDQGEDIAQSKRARAGSLAIVDSPQVARTCILPVFLLGWTTACSSMPESDGKVGRIVQSKRARAGSLATVDSPQVARVSSRRFCCLSLALRLFRFGSFVFLLFNPRPFV